MLYEVITSVVDGTDRLLRTEAVGAIQGWLGEGFVEGMRVRITNLADPSQYVDAKIAIIRGFNDSKDATLQFTLETTGDFRNNFV